MGGLGGVGLGGNQPQIINLTGTINVGNIGELQPGGIQPRVEPQPGATPQEPASLKPPRAADVTGQLDILLLKAAKGASGDVSARDVANAAENAKLPKQMLNNLKSLAKTAQNSLAALDKFTGKDLAAAMERQPDGTLDWKKDSKVGKAFNAAMKAQEELSMALANALGKASDENAQATLEELMLQCDRRVGEMDTLVLQMTEIIDAGGENALENAAALTNGGKISTFTSADALDKFGRAEMFNALKSDLKPLTDRLDAYAKDGLKNLDKADIDACVKELDAIKDKFSAAAASGRLEVGGKTVFVDRSLINEASKLLDGVGKKIGNIHHEVLHAAMVKFIEKDIPFIDEEIFSPRFADELHKLENTNGYDSQVLEKFAKKLNEFRSASRAYAESPTDKNAAKLKGAARIIENMVLETDIEKSVSVEAIGSFKPNAKATPEFQKAFQDFRFKMADQSCGEAIRKLVGSAYENMQIAAEKLISLGKEYNAGPNGKYFVSSAVLDVFKGEMSLSPLLESRVHGYSDSDINLDLDDKNIASSKTLGKGNFNTVTLVKGKDGSEWVFKPELAGRLTAPNSPLNHGLGVNQEITRVNLAVQTTADTLGLGDIMVKTSVGTHNGQFGMFMEKAPGTTGKQLKDTKNPVDNLGMVGPSRINQMGDAEFGKVVGSMMRQLNRMQWFDTITGQGDRHSDNYMVDINGTDFTVVIKAIDNDASYGTYRKGLYRFRLEANSGMADLFNNAINKLANGVKGGMTKGDFVKKIFSDPGVKKTDGGAIELDLSKSENPLLVSGLLNLCAIKNIAPPAEIDKELHDKLMALDREAPDGGKARNGYLSSLAERLGEGSEQYTAAVQRLDESIEHARKLNDAGKVYSAEQWDDHEIQRKIAAPNMDNMKGEINTYGAGFDKKMSDYFAGKGKYLNYTNNFFRDFYEALVKDTNHADWFNAGTA